MAGQPLENCRDPVSLPLASENANRRIVESMNLIEIIDELRTELTDID